ncbi:MAG: FkbM family methyltransferase [Leptospiraceae bacterium]|nr:FkbM family methyltransferase [Leptospiraceae bacterium]
MSFFRKKLRSLSWHLFHRIENNGNCDFFKNGEFFFLRNLLKYFKDKKLSIPFVFFDIGANIGTFSEYLLCLADKLGILVEAHLFEPQTKCFEMLVSKFCKRTSMEINNYGISNFSGEGLIYFDTEGSGLASIYNRDLEHLKINMNKKSKILLKRLEDYIREKSVTHINFIKIDVEGGELDVLHGMGDFLNHEFIDVIQFEYGGANLDSKTTLLELYRVLENAGFVLGKVMPKGIELRNYQSFMENFSYSNYVAFSKELVK